jgi:hypothetical protein
VMGWQSPHTQTEMTWTLQPTGQGTRLRVVEWGHVGTTEIARERALTQLFEGNLRSLLERPATVPAASGASAEAASAASSAVVAAPAPGSAAPSPAIARAAEVDRAPSDGAGHGSVGTPAPPVELAYPGVGRAPVGHAAPRSYVRSAVWLGLLVVAVVLALVALWILWPPIPAGGGARTSAGLGGVGSSPGVGATGPSPGGGGGGSPPGAGQVMAPTTPVDVGLSVAGAPGQVTQPGPAHLAAWTQVSGTLTYSLTVTITNDGGMAGDWMSARGSSLERLAGQQRHVGQRGVLITGMKGVAGGVIL